VDAQIAIVGAAGMEERLEGALLTKLRPLSRQMKDRLFDGYGPLASFSAKIDMAYALEIIPKEIYDTLRNINRIRVAFAHPKTVISFTDEKVSPILNNLGLDADTPGVSRRYLTKLAEVDTYLKAQTAPEHLAP
jgi:DNA-binding MltR family transcriptional regulator